MNKNVPLVNKCLLVSVCYNMGRLAGLPKMINQHYLLKHRELFQYVSGISYVQFVLLLPKFAIALRKAEYAKAWKKKRIREPGGGRKATLKTDEEKLFFILWYYKI